MPARRSQARSAKRRPVLLGTRMPVNAIVDNFEYGVRVAEIVEQVEIPPDRIEAVLTYAKTHRIAHRI